MSKPAFLTIASELRLSIYRHLFSDVVVAVCPENADQPKSVDRSYLNILLTCKQVHAEARPILMSHALFDITSSAAVAILHRAGNSQIKRVIIKPLSKQGSPLTHSLDFGMEHMVRGRDEVHIHLPVHTLRYISNTSAEGLVAVVKRMFSQQSDLILPRSARPSRRPELFAGEFILDCIKEMYHGNSHPTTQSLNGSGDTGSVKTKASEVKRTTPVLYISLQGDPPPAPLSPASAMRLRPISYGHPNKEQKLQYLPDQHALRCLNFPEPQNTTALPSRNRGWPDGKSWLGINRSKRLSRNWYALSLIVR